MDRREPAGVQSVSRALDVLEAVEAAGGVLSVSETAERVALSLPTTHRLAQALVARGYLRQLPDRRYCLGSRLVPLGAGANALVGERSQPVLRRLAGEVGESANLAVLAGDVAEYVCQAPGSHAMRMFTEVGRRVALHCTGVGKALLATLDDTRARGLLLRAPLVAQTASTLTSVDAVLAQLAEIRSRGYALDDGEMEVGVRCVAVPVRTMAPMAVSVSGPSARMGADLLGKAVPALLRAADELGTALADR